MNEWVSQFLSYLCHCCYILSAFKNFFGGRDGQGRSEFWLFGDKLFFFFSLGWSVNRILFPLEVK